MSYIHAIAHGEKVDPPGFINKIIAIAAYRIVDKEKASINSSKLLELIDAHAFQEVLNKYPYLKNLLVFGILKDVSDSPYGVRIFIEEKHINHELVMYAIREGAIVEVL